ncbi:MAG: hypothetical protein V3R86_06900 [Candidatus Hydrothermarchaeaceae archaeon]
MLGLFSLLIFAAADTFSIFKSQHLFQNVIDCSSCHKDEAGNLTISLYHSSFKCLDCHGVTPGDPSSHAAQTISCTQCHSDVVTKITSPYEAHKPYYESALENEKGYTTTGPNEACISCHTMYGAKITYSYPAYVDYSVDDWVITQLIPGPARDYVTDKTSGNLHLWIDKLSINCANTCHLNIKQGILNETYGRLNHTHVPDVTAEAWGGTPHDFRSPARPVDNNYCFECHKSNFAHASQVHAAEALSCLTCHDSGGVSPIGRHGMGMRSNDLFAEISLQPRRYHADICIGCHHNRPEKSINVHIEAEPGGMMYKSNGGMHR